MHRASICEEEQAPQPRLEFEVRLEGPPACLAKVFISHCRGSTSYGAPPLLSCAGSVIERLQKIDNVSRAEEDDGGLEPELR